MPCSLRFPVGSEIRVHLDLLQPELVELREIGLRELGDHLAGAVDQSRHWRLVVRLGHVDEILAVGRQRDRVG